MSARKVCSYEIAEISFSRVLHENLTGVHYLTCASTRYVGADYGVFGQEIMCDLEHLLSRGHRRAPGGELSGGSFDGKI